jgi:hypothetical protein
MVKIKQPSGVVRADWNPIDLIKFGTEEHC